MTREEWLMALSFLASCEADAAALRGESELQQYMFALSDEASSMAGPDPDSAWEGMRRWIESRPPRATGVLDGCPPVPQTHAVLGI